jgi:hypothetical protein
VPLTWAGPRAVYVRPMSGDAAVVSGGLSDDGPGLISPGCERLKLVPVRVVVGDTTVLVWDAASPCGPVTVAECTCAHWDGPCEHLLAALAGAEQPR